MAAEAPAARRRVVIVGGGFGGLTAARALRRSDVDVTLVDPMSHHLFQPLLYQLACGGLSTGEVALPIRAGVKRAPNVSVLMASATNIDVENRQLVLDRGERLEYDSLIVAAGAETSYFGNDEWREVSYGLKTLEDAVNLRNRVYAALEEAERTDDPAEREQWLTFIVIGGGPTGVELAGELAVLVHHSMKGYFTRVEPSQARVILLDAGDRLVTAFSEKLSAYVARSLGTLGVTVREHARVTSIDARGVTVQVEGSDERIAARTVVWAAGVRAVGFAATLAQATGAATDRAGRVQITPGLTVPGHPEISAIGDMTLIDGAAGKPLPGLATVAIQQARHVARAIHRGEAGASTPFRYFDKGALAVVGRGRAVCELRGHEFAGRLAFFTYLTVHMYYLSGGGAGHRVKVLIDWIGARTGEPQNQVIDGRLASEGRLRQGAAAGG
jgi:NADH:ubiquinone reductase (H+-translocating)